jgi:hypothetical protein
MFIDYDKLNDMTHRMEAVAASMEKSVTRLETAIERLATVEPLTIETKLHIDGKEIARHLGEGGDGGGAGYIPRGGRY